MVRVKPWMIKGRRMERNAPQGYRCDSTCTHPVPQMGTKVCLCTVCHEVFGTPANFDRHRKDGWCQNPEELGLIIGERGFWVTPWTVEARNRISGTPGMDEED